MGRRPELKSDEFFEVTPISSRDNLTFMFETAETSVAVIGGATLPFDYCTVNLIAKFFQLECGIEHHSLETGVPVHMHLYLQAKQYRPPKA